MVAKDCPRKNIWRTQTHMTDYKAGLKPAPSGRIFYETSIQRAICAAKSYVVYCNTPLRSR